MKCVHRGWNLDSARISQSHSICKTVSFSSCHVSQVGQFTSPSLDRCSFKRQCLTNNSVTCLGLFLFNFNTLLVLLAQCSWKKPSARLCTCVDYQPFLMLSIHTVLDGLLSDFSRCHRRICQMTRNSLQFPCHKNSYQLTALKIPKSRMC
jgi:hypothetical protein